MTGLKMVSRTWVFVAVRVDVRNTPLGPDLIKVARGQNKGREVDETEERNRSCI